MAGFLADNETTTSVELIFPSEHLIIRDPTLVQDTQI